MELAIVGLFVVLLIVATPVLICRQVVRTLRRANQVSPRIPTLAPPTWLVLPERPARLHRRLRRALAMARAAAATYTRQSRAGVTTIPELVADLEHRACVVDSQLVVAARTSGPARWSMLNDVERQVYEIDTLATRIVGLTAAWAASAATAGRGGPAGLAAIGERLDALEAAMFEVGALGQSHPSYQPAPSAPSAQPIPYLRRIEGERD
jgi:hypothetical protein